MAFNYYNWEEVNLNWNDVNLNWEEVGFLDELVSNFISFPPIGSSQKPKYDIKKINELPKEKKKIIIKIVAKIQGEEFIEYKYKNDSSINITVEHIDTIIDKISNNIKVYVQNIS